MSACALLCCQLYVLEESSESLARQLLLLSTFFDTASLSPMERMETFLDLHHNALTAQRTAAYVSATAKRLINALAPHEPTPLDASGTITVDPSLLKHRSLDDVLSHLAFIASPTSPSPSPSPLFDVVALREARLRHYYGDRYDARMNVVDWDYHFRLKAIHSILHVVHFRRWRVTGQAYEKRDCVYDQPNRSLASYREGKLRGRGAVRVCGYWGDVVVGPQAVWGSACDDDALYEVRQDQHVHTSVDVAERNVSALMATPPPPHPAVTVHLLLGAVSALPGRRFAGLFHRAFMAHGRCTQVEELRRVMRAGAWLTMDTLWGWPVPEDDKRAGVRKLRELGEKAGWEWKGGRKEGPNAARGGSEGKDRTGHGEKFISFVWPGQVRGHAEEKQQVSECV